MMNHPNFNKNHQKVSAHSHFKRLGRELAMQYLYLRDMAEGEDDADAREMFWEQAAEAELTDDDRTFKKARIYAEKVVDGIIAHLKEIDDTIASFSEKWDLSRIAAVERNIIRVAIYELKYCPDIPALVSIDEAIEISKAFATEKSGVFINGILNGVKDSLPPDAKLRPGGR